MGVLMSTSELCRCCGQPLPSQTRAGVYLPARKARIFDCIANHPDISPAGVVAKCFDETAPVSVVHAHVNQINDRLAGTGTRIQYRKPGYRVVTIPTVTP